MRRSTLILTSLSLLCLHRVAHAGPVELLTQFVIHPTDSKRMVVRYYNGGDGAFVTDDGGRNWKLLCDSLLFDPAMTHGGPLVISSDGTMSMGVFTGLWHDDGRACGWSAEPRYEGRWVSAFALDPTDPTITYAATSSGGKPNGVLRRDASGAWSDLGVKADVLFTDLHVVSHAGSRRFYAGAAKGEFIPPDGGAPETIYAIRVSDDDGATWTEHPYGPSDGNVQVQAVDPNNPDRIVISVERAQSTLPPASKTDNVFVSSDQGKTFRHYLDITEIGGVAFTPDGGIYIGDAGDVLGSAQPAGLYYSRSLDEPATKLAMGDYPVQCLDYESKTKTLYACQRWTFGVVDPTSGAFTTSLDVRKVAGFVDCAGVDMAAVCRTQLCGAYCGLGHFAQAPVCCAYDTISCGPAAAQNAVCPAAGGATGAGGAQSAGGASGVSTNVFDAGSGADADASAAGGSKGGTPGASTAHGGGGCAIESRSRGGSFSAAALALVAAAFARRRRR